MVIGPGPKRQMAVARIAAFALPSGLALMLAVWLLAGTPTEPTAPTGSLQVVGSETMRPLITACAEAFMTVYPKTDVIVRGGGSGDGVAALLHGMVDVGMTSRALSPKELEFAAARAIGLVVADVALDGIAIIVHRSNPVRQLDLEQLRRIYAGEVSHWEILAGTGGQIRTVGRAAGSGTAALFAERVLGGSAESGTAQLMPTNEAVVAEVAAHPGAIGYTGLGAIRHATDRVVFVAIGATSQAAPELPTAAAVRAGGYPISHRLALVAAAPASDVAAAFIAHCTGQAGQAMAQRAGYVDIAPTAP